MSRRRRSRRALRSWLITYAIALTIALASVTSALALVDRTVDEKIDAIDKIPIDLTPSDPGGSANYLLIGSDTREGVESEQEPDALGGAGDQRSDTIMVLHVDPQAQNAVLVSFPRDLIVDIPGIGESKINAAYNEGPQTLVDTLEGNFPITINHYVSVDFASFAGIVDAMGGIRIDFPYVARNETTPFFVGVLGPACYTLNGGEALNYVRQRSGVSEDDPGYQQYIDGEWVEDPIPDLGRIARQQDFVRQLATQAFKRSRNDPLAASRIAGEVLSELQVDDRFDRSSVNALIGAFDSVDPSEPESLQMLTIPNAGFESRSDLGAVMLIDEAAAAPMFDLLNGTTALPAEPDPTTATTAPSDVTTTTTVTTAPPDPTGPRLPDSTRC